MRQMTEQAIANRERVKRFRKQKRAAGFRQILVWVEGGQLERFRKVCREKGVNQEQALSEALALYGAPASFRICPHCKGYGCDECRETGWLNP